MPYPRKRFAQHWLKDDSVHQAILAASGLLDPSSPCSCVLEIGPGTGQLTRRLLATGTKVIAVEVDRDLYRILKQSMGDHPRLQLIEGDFLKLPLPAEPQRVVANIPYNITSPILDKIVGSPEHPVLQFQKIVLLVQRDLAERLQAQPGTKAYGSMSINIQYLADCHIVKTVPPQAFKPAPKVESAVIELSPRPWPYQAQDPRWFSILVKQGFATRRKQLVNALQSLVPKEAMGTELTNLALDPDIRAEQLTLDQWVTLSDALQQYRQPKPTTDLVSS